MHFLSPCHFILRLPGCTLLLRAARIERHDFGTKRAYDSVSLTDPFDRNVLISELSESVQKSSGPACVPSVLWVERGWIKKGQTDCQQQSWKVMTKQRAGFFFLCHVMLDLVRFTDGQHERYCSDLLILAH